MRAPALNSLQITGLTLAWFTTYVIMCAVNGTWPLITDATVPSRLFAFGGVLGMQRPMVEVAFRTTCAGLIGCGALGICDFFYARHTKARYFALHVICNAWISMLTLPDLIHMMTDPVGALTQHLSPNHWPTALVFSIHIYHMVFFTNLQWIDWLHHILMVVIGAPLLITGELGPLMNFNHFFMCGVPGGADYAMLFAVKHGWMKPLDEKKYNAAINVWVREPALVATAIFGFMQMHMQETTFSKGIYAVRAFLMLLAMWNGLFFMERVVGNYHVCSYKEKKEKQEERRGSRTGTRTGTPVNGSGGRGEGPGEGLEDEEPSIYESEEHFSTSMPGMGMRVSVSTAELTAISKEQDSAGLTAADAGAKGMASPYPVGIDGGKKQR